MNKMPSQPASGTPAPQPKKALAKVQPKKAPAGAPPGPETAWSPTRYLTIGLIGLAILVGGFGGWSLFANISGAIISSGRVAVDSNRQVVQHPDGGVVDQILVREGDRVEAGQTLIRLDPTLLSSNAEILRDQLYEIVARGTRLEAERDGLDTLAFPDDLVAAADDPDVAGMIDGQRNLFAARQEAISREREQLERRKEQIASQVSGIEAQSEALQLQLEFVREELAAQKALLERGLAQAPRVLSLQREEARLLGQAGEFEAGVAELEGRATEIDIEVLKLGTRQREEAISQLRDLRFRQVELMEQLRAADEQLARLDIKAPVDGIVYDLQVFAERAVLRPAEPLLFLVPQDRPLVIQTQVDPIHIDQVFPGQDVTLRLPTFDARTTPEIFGSVIRVSPDAFTDETTGMTYYQAELLPNEGEVERLNGQVMLPGMPVEAYLRTADRSPMEYLIKPLADYFNRAFREG